MLFLTELCELRYQIVILEVFSFTGSNLHKGKE